MMLNGDRRQYIRDLRAQRHSLTVDTVIRKVVPLVNSLFNDANDVKAMEDASLLIPLIYTHLNDASKRATVKRYMTCLGHRNARVRKSAASVFGEMAMAMVGVTVPADEDMDEEEDEEEANGIVRDRRKCQTARMKKMKKTKKPASAWSCTLDPYIDRVRAQQRRREALKPIEETEAVRATREYMSVTLSPLYCHMVFHQSHEPGISLVALQSIVPVARAFGRKVMQLGFLSSLRRHAQTALSPPAQALLLSSLPKLQVTLGPELSHHLFHFLFDVILRGPHTLLHVVAMRQVAAIRRNLRKDLMEVGNNRRLYWVIRDQWDSFERRLAVSRGSLGVPRSIHANQAMDMATLVLSLRCAPSTSSSPYECPLCFPLSQQDHSASNEITNIVGSRPTTSTFDPSIWDLSPPNGTYSPLPHPPDPPNSPPPYP